jgi:hypothetical protein
MSADKAGGVPCADAIDEEVHTQAQSPRIEASRQPGCADFLSASMLFYSRAGRIMFKV